MARGINRQDVDALVGEGVDLYGILDLERSGEVSEREIRRSYRKKALVYHPDKDPSDEAKLKFDLISRALEVLLDSDLKKYYDEKLELIHQGRVRNQKLSQELQDLRINLQRKELLHRDKIINNQRRELKIEYLKLDALRRIKIKQEQRLKDAGSKLGSLYGKDYRLKYTSEPPTLRLRWKLRQDLPDMVSNGAIRSLMEIFGDIAKIEPLKQLDKRYDYCLIKYKEFSGFNRALKHDYSKTSDIWDSQGLRKLSSLLRGVEIVNESGNDGNEMYFEDYFDSVIDKMNKASTSV